MCERRQIRRSPRRKRRTKTAKTSHTMLEDVMRVPLSLLYFSVVPHFHVFGGRCTQTIPIPISAALKSLRSIKECACTCQLIQECSFFVYGDTAWNQNAKAHCYPCASRVCDVRVEIWTRNWVYVKGNMLLDNVHAHTRTHRHVYVPNNTYRYTRTDTYICMYVCMHACLFVFCYKPTRYLRHLLMHVEYL